MITKNNKNDFCQKQTMKEAESTQWTSALALETYLSFVMATAPFF